MRGRYARQGLQAFADTFGKGVTTEDEEWHVGDFEYNPAWKTYAAVDYGFTNPNVWLLIQVDPFGEQIVVLDEVYQNGLSPDEFADEIKRRGLAPSDVITFYPDPASPGDTRIGSNVGRRTRDEARFVT